MHINIKYNGMHYLKKLILKEPFHTIIKPGIYNISLAFLFIFLLKIKNQN